MSVRRSTAQLVAEDPRGAGERLRKLQLITDAALLHLQLDELLEEILLRVRTVFAADTCAILLRESDHLVPRAAKGLEEEVERAVRVPLGGGFAGRVATERRPIALPRLRPGDVENPILLEKGVRSLLGAPLLVDERVLGVIHLGSLAERDWDEEDHDLLALAAARAARGLEKALVHERLVQLDRLKEAFIAVAAHELRTPAATISGAAATLYHRLDTLPPDQLRELVAMLHEQGERLVRLTEQLFDLSKLHAGEVSIRPRRMPLEPLLSEIVGATTGDDSGAVTIEAPAELESIVDPHALERIVANLVLNALRHGRPPIRVRAEQRDRQLRITVEDTGPGVDLELQSRIFEQFERGQSAQPNNGAGLGLAIARTWASAHNGE